MLIYSNITFLNNSLSILENLNKGPKDLILPLISLILTIKPNFLSSLFLKFGLAFNQNKSNALLKSVLLKILIFEIE